QGAPAAPVAGSQAALGLDGQRLAHELPGDCVTQLGRDEDVLPPGVRLRCRRVTERLHDLCDDRTSLPPHFLSHETHHSNGEGKREGRIVVAASCLVDDEVSRAGRKASAPSPLPSPAHRLACGRLTLPYS